MKCMKQTEATKTDEHVHVQTLRQLSEYIKYLQQLFQVCEAVQECWAIHKCQLLLFFSVMAGLVLSALSDWLTSGVQSIKIIWRTGINGRFALNTALY